LSIAQAIPRSSATEGAKPNADLIIGGGRSVIDTILRAIQQQCPNANIQLNVMSARQHRAYHLAAAGKLEGARALRDARYEVNQAVFFDINPIPMK
jgi:hypothetical protein